MKTRLRGALFALLPGLVCSAEAQILHDNGDPSGGYGVTILSELDTFNQVGDDLQLAGSVVLHTLEWWGSEQGNNFVVRLFAFEGDLPSSTPLLDLNVGPLTGEEQSFPGPSAMFYSCALPDVALEAGRYLLSIVDQSSNETWFWSASCEDGCEGGSWRRPLDDDAWSEGNFDMAFRLLGTPVTSDVPGGGPPSPLLLHNVPNPFNPGTRIHFRLPRSGPVRLSIFDVEGRLVRTILDARMLQGEHAIFWDATDDAGTRLSTGVYLYHLQTPDAASTRKMLLLQ